MSDLWTIQAYDYEEGTAAMWFSLENARFETKELAREYLRKLRANEPEDSMFKYRVVEIGSDEYYSQPTDKLEY